MAAQNYRQMGNAVPVAGLGARFSAWLIDAALCAVPALLTFGALAYVSFSSLRFFGEVSLFQTVDEILRLIAQNTGQYFYIPLLAFGVWIFVAILMSVLGGMKGQTPGRKLVRIRLISADSHEPLGGDRALLRGTIFNVIGAIPLAGVLLNVIMILSDSQERQGPHDRATRALIVSANFDPAVARMHAATRMSADSVPPPSPLARNLDAPRQAAAPPAPLPPWLERPPAARPAPPPRPVPPAPRPAAPAPPTPVNQHPPVPSSPAPVIPAVPPRPVPAESVAATPVPTEPSAEVSGAGQRREAPSEIDAEVEMTRLVPAGESRRAYRPSEPDPVRARIRVSDGQVVDIRGTTLVGRNPAPRPNERAATLLSVHDPARSVSKTHLVLGLDERGLWVADRTSTNGSVVTLADGQQIVCMPEQQVRVSPGAKIQLGDVAITVLPV